MNQYNIKPQELLTGKALKSFNEWLFKTHGLYLYNVFNQTILYALIIDWLDSVGIDVQLEVFDSCISYSIKDFKSTILYDCYMSFDTRHQATQEAIKKAVEIFNNKP